MTLDDATVAKVAQLARLRLSEAELAMVRGDLAQILTHVAALADIDTSGVAPLWQPHVDLPSEVAALRADQPWPSLPQAEVLALAPASAGGHFVVPKVV